MNVKKQRRTAIIIGLGLVLMMVALYMVFIYVPTEKSTGIIQRIFYFHVPVAWVSFLAFFVTFVASIAYLAVRQEKWDAIASASAEVGVLFTTLVLITGPIWAKPAWGIWWTWDARLTTSLVLWLIYIAYLLVRSFAAEPARSARYSAVIGIIGFIDVPLVFVTVNLWRTQHPTTIIFEGGLTTSMLATLLVCIVAFTVLYLIMVIQRTGIKTLDAEVKRLRSQLAEQGGDR
jgi:heme exporter protein C